MVKSKRVRHKEFGFCLVSPFRSECDWEVADALLFDWEVICVLRRYDEILTILGHVRLPLDLYVPIPVCVVHNRQILSYFSSSRHVHLQNRLQRFRLDGKANPIPSDICLGLVIHQNKVIKLINWVFTENCERDFILWIYQLVLLLLLRLMFVIFWFLGLVGSAFVDVYGLLSVYVRVWIYLNCVFLVDESVDFLLFLLFSAFFPL